MLFIMSDLMTEKVIGAAIEVHRHLGPGLSDASVSKPIAI